MFRKKPKLTIDSKETYTEIGAEIFGIIFSSLELLWVLPSYGQVSDKTTSGLRFWACS